MRVPGTPGHLASRGARHRSHEHLFVLRAGKIGLHQLQKSDAKKKYGEELIETIAEAYWRQQTGSGESH